MRHIFITFYFLLFSHLLTAQLDSIKVVDNSYKEDQFYAGVTYNVIGKIPDGISQTGFSNGVHFGFIKDIPVNKQRNVAIGIGIGASINSYNQNLSIVKNDNQSYSYSVIDRNTIDYTKNRFFTNLIELPLEFRWRTSTATDYKFWRIYSGIKLGYVLANAYKFEDDEDNDIVLRGIDDFNTFQYGLTFSTGYNTWNFYFYYALNPIFANSVTIDGKVINANEIKIGLIFYIL